jgi:hypothetical protein
MLEKRPWLTGVSLALVGGLVIIISLQRVQARSVSGGATASPTVQAALCHRTLNDWWQPDLPGSVPYLVQRVGDRIALALANDEEAVQLRLLNATQRNTAAHIAWRNQNYPLAVDTLSKGFIYFSEALLVCQKHDFALPSCQKSNERWRSSFAALQATTIDFLQGTQDDKARSRLDSLRARQEVLQAEFSTLFL